MRPTIRLFVCDHRPSPPPAHPLLTPIQVGAALAPAHFPGMIPDDSRDNISALNRSYCELTAHYWAWKNDDADYCGFFHYRRYLYPGLRDKTPYRLEREPTPELLHRLGYDGFAELIGRYDVIVPVPEDMYMPVREHYARAPYHHAGDLALAGQLVLERTPEMAPALEAYLGGSGNLFGNLLIMRRTVFEAYCDWLFGILAEFDRRADTSAYGPQERRVDGYLGERLLGVYLTHHSELRRLSLPRVHFCPGRDYWPLRLRNALLPPGSWRRSAVKAAFRG